MNLENVYKCKSTEEAVDLLGKFKEDSKVISGGTDLIIGIRNNKFNPKVLIDVFSIEKLREINLVDDYVELGGAVTFTQIVENPLFKSNLYGLYKSCRLVGSPQIRNKGTIGGNICNGSTAADTIPPLIALKAKIFLESTSGTRQVLLEDIFKDKELKIRDDELLTKIRFKLAKENQILSFAKLGLRKALAISRIAISTFIELDGDKKISLVNVASGSIGRYPMRENSVEEYLLGKEINDETILQAVKVLQNEMDKRLEGRASLPYKRHAVEGILRESLEDGLKFFGGGLQ